MLVAISQRHSGEHHGMDMLEVSYVRYFAEHGVTLVPLPNQPDAVQQYFDALRFDGVILSGGGDIQPELYGGDATTPGNYAPERDETEHTMLALALEQGIPVLGICRGMEYINVYFGGAIQPLTAVAGGLVHDETRHDVRLVNDTVKKEFGRDTIEVNSYHRMVVGADQLSAQLRPFAVAADHTIEGFYHPGRAVAAIVWHPERETALHSFNEYLINAFLTRTLFWQPSKGSML